MTIFRLDLFMVNSLDDLGVQVGVVCMAKVPGHPSYQGKGEGSSGGVES